MSIATGYELAVVIVAKGWSDPVIESIRAAGGTGATVLHGRGAGSPNIPKLLGIPIEPEKEIVLSIVPRDIARTVLDAVTKTLGLCKPNTGIAMLLPLSGVAGLMEEVGGGC